LLIEVEIQNFLFKIYPNAQAAMSSGEYISLPPNMVAILTVPFRIAAIAYKKNGKPRIVLQHMADL